MKSRILPICLASLVLMSCTKSQYLVFSSDLPYDRYEGFKSIEDEVEVNYSFLAGSGFMVTIYNNSDSLIYVDWDKSSMVINGRAKAFRKGSFNLEATSYQFASAKSTHEMQILGSGEFIPSATREYIPPHSTVTEIYDAVHTSYQHFAMPKVHECDSIFGKYGYYSFDPNNSAYHYRSYIHINTLNGEHPKVLDHSFWLSDIINTNNNLPARGNVIRESELTGVGSFFTVTGTLFGIILAVLAEAETVDE
ncbi:hypothetical protein [Reichenbachiella versicolor]|uniref:hypothetical protein n=1 Tax=Reichenbachiella versicolor TaxID=1821036 RepID=UPI0013A5AE40|nr:hypothetical protein [Reichenbachiella versicolor]